MKNSSARSPRHSRDHLWTLIESDRQTCLWPHPQSFVSVSLFISSLPQIPVLPYFAMSFPKTFFYANTLLVQVAFSSIFLNFPLKHCSESIQPPFRHAITSAFVLILSRWTTICRHFSFFFFSLTLLFAPYNLLHTTCFSFVVIQTDTKYIEPFFFYSTYFKLISTRRKGTTD